MIYHFLYICCLDLVISFLSYPVPESGRPQETRPQVESAGHEGSLRCVQALGRRSEGRPRRRAGADRRGQKEQGRSDAGMVFARYLIFSHQRSHEAIVWFDHKGFDFLLMKFNFQHEINQA